MKVNAISVATEKRKQDALYFRTMGLTYQEVLEAMLAQYGQSNLPDSYDVRYVWRDIQDAMNRLKAETMESAAQMRFIEAQRLDRMMMSILGDANSGNLKCIAQVLKIIDMKAKLFGLYAPAQVNVKDWRSEVLQLLRDGRITIEDVKRELGDEEARKLLESRSGDVIEGIVVEGESTTEPSE